MSAHPSRVMLLALAVGLALPALPARAEDADTLNPLQALGKAALDTFVQKPLFDPTRQLPPAPPAIVVDTTPPPPPPPEPPPNLQLIGVVRGLRGDMAIVHRDGSDKTLVLHTGDKLGSWTVTVRPPVGVRLRDGGRSADFAIFAKGVLPRPPMGVVMGAPAATPPSETITAGQEQPLRPEDQSR